MIRLKFQFKILCILQHQTTIWIVSSKHFGSVQFQIGVYRLQNISHEPIIFNSTNIIDHTELNFRWRKCMETVKEPFYEIYHYECWAYPVIRLTALSAMLISRDCKFGQENARHASIVASTSLQQMSEGHDIRTSLVAINYSGSNSKVKHLIFRKLMCFSYGATKQLLQSQH